jgi:trimeric autotransporter adhesin
MAIFNGRDGINDTLFGTSEDDSLNGFGGNDLLVGDAGNDTLFGGLDNDIMRGGSGDDTYFVGDAGDQVIENPNEGTDIIRSTVDVTLPTNVENLTVFGISPALRRATGNELNNRIVDESAVITVDLFGAGGDDVLIGSTRNNLLDGGTGNDTMTGGSGNDTYIVDSAGDVVQETVDGGIDTVVSIVDHTLAANVENLLLFNVITQSTAVNGTGNELNNTILGNAFNNTLRGLAGDDTIDGGFGNDTLEGGDGNDTLNGGAGNDTMNGGAGNDTMNGGTGNDVYLVTDAGDIVNEGTDAAAGNPLLGGVDLVRATVDFTLGRNVENLTLEGTAANGTGNELNNEIIGNSVANVMEGLAGNDRILGGSGNDILRGGLGNDNLQGDRGKDVMTGGEGADGFFFDLNSPFNLGAIGKDVIRDFTSGVDRIVLDQTTFGPISRADIALVVDDADAALSDKRIVYSEETGKLFFNANGTERGFGRNGSGGYFVTLQGTPDFAISDIVVQP